MFTDARIGTGLEAMFRGIDAPPVPLPEIQRKIAQPQRVSRHLSRYLIPAAAAALALVAAVPAISPAFVQSLEARIRALLPSHPPPRSVTSAMRTQTARLATAQSRVPFTIVSPAGLPNDVTSATISTTPTAVYSKATRSWRVGSPDVQFTYQRSGGRSFFLIADRFDPQVCLPGKYIFEKDGTAPDGHSILTKREHFAWRNGNQLMEATEDEDISAPEIEAIRIAMHGIALPPRPTLTPCKSGEIKKILIAAP